MNDDVKPPLSTRARKIEILIARGNAEIRDGDFESAKDYFDEAIQLDPVSAEARRSRGLAWHYLQEYGNALEDYNEAVRLRPDDPRTLVNRGTARFAKADFEGAAADYTEVLRLDPANLDALKYRAGALLKLEQYEAAIRDLDEVIQREPSEPRGYHYRAGAWLKLGKTDRELADLDETLRLDPRRVEALTRRKQILEERGDGEKAGADEARLQELRSSAARHPRPQKRTFVNALMREHFAPSALDDLTITERLFPFRVRADLQRAAQSLFGGTVSVRHYCGIRSHYSHEGLNFTALVMPSEHDPPVSVPPEYEEIDIGEPVPVRCPKVALWLLEQASVKFAVLLCPATQYGQVSGLKFQLAVPNTPEGTRITEGFFKHLEDSVLRSQSYRGKVLSLESRDTYSGRSSGLLVHPIKSVRREEVILPKKTLDLLDRNVLSFARQRHRLGEFGLSKKKGVLLHGPPGNGKTHTIHYLAKALEGYTTFLITAGQMGLLNEYMTLARLLQPSLVVIEDVDLIARDRESMNNACAESLLNVLLNEMDGLQQDSEVIFILTTNRPEALEAALASRPGRVDQAIEYPLPDEECRAKLIALYSRGLRLSPDLVRDCVRKTKGVSASFIRELMRRSAQFHLERGATTGDLAAEDLHAALEELVSGVFNRRLLGAEPGQTS